MVRPRPRAPVHASPRSACPPGEESYRRAVSPGESPLATPPMSGMSPISLALMLSSGWHSSEVPPGRYRWRQETCRESTRVRSFSESNDPAQAPRAERPALERGRDPRLPGADGWRDSGVIIELDGCLPTALCDVEVRSWSIGREMPGLNIISSLTIDRDFDSRSAILGLKLDDGCLASLAVLQRIQPPRLAGHCRQTGRVRSGDGNNFFWRHTLDSRQRQGSATASREVRSGKSAQEAVGRTQWLGSEPSEQEPEHPAARLV